MSYTPTEWEPTDVVTATRMNALETAVGDMNMSYTPNVWSDGDILSAEKMNALEQAVASGGGGGSSDFSTAEVTVVNNSVNEVELPLIFVDSIPMVGGILSGVAYIDPQDTQTFSAVLYDNEAFTDVYGLNASVSGNASIGNDVATITGDCTITIS